MDLIGEQEDYMKEFGCGSGIGFCYRGKIFLFGDRILYMELELEVG